MTIFQDEQKTLLFFGFQLGMPKTDHASWGLSRKAKRLDSSQRRGRLVHALLKPFLLLSFIFSFPLLLSIFPQKGLTLRVLLERVNRQLRRKFRQALSFGSTVGAEVALYLQIQRLHAQWKHTSWWQTSHALSLDLLQVHHP